MLHKLAIATTAEVPTLAKDAAVTTRADQLSGLTLSPSVGEMAGNLKDTYLKGAKNFLGGKGLLGNKWGNRAIAAGGLGALGLGIKAYLDSNKLRERPAEQPVSEEVSYPAPQAQQANQYYYDMYSGYPKMGADKYSPDAVTIPKPTAQPTVKALGPGVSSTPKITGSSKGGGGLLGGSSGGSGGGGASSSGSSGKQASDSGVIPLLGAAAGGAGGWALGNKLLAPALEQQQQTLIAEIAKKQSQLKNLNKVTSAAPLGAAAAGAILLAALAALYAKRGNGAKAPALPIEPYDQTGAGFQQQGYNPYGQFYG